MKVIHVATEFAHLAKAGGLADVLYGLSKEQAKQRVDVEIILPKYSFINQDKIQNVHLISRNETSTIYRTYHENIPIVLIDIPEAFHRDNIYGYKDDPDRFISFCDALQKYLETLDASPDIVHLHDWPTALLALLLKRSPLSSSIVFTIHNLQYQGKCTPSHLDRIGLKGLSYLTEDLLQDPEDTDSLNLLKAGIIFSDVFNTVAPTYAKEILTEEYGYGLHNFLKKYKHKLYGILNGIDEHYWSPSHDPFLSQHLSESFSLGELTAWKHSYRKILSDNHDLDFAPDKPLLISITRLAEQKGPHLIIKALLSSLEKGGQSFLLGSSHDPKLHEDLISLNNQFRDNKNIQMHFEYDESLSHMLYAAADMIVIPSLFEPCGLTQMIARRYGTLPIVRLTGGLADTVQDLENGFTFTHFTPEDMGAALERAFSTFRDKSAWQVIMQNGLNTHHDCSDSAKSYQSLYEVALGELGEKD